MMIIYTQ